MRAPRARHGLLVATIACGWVVASCSAAPPPLSTHNLERPSDMVFTCMGLFDPADGDVTPRVSGRPMSECHRPGQFDPPADIAHRTVAFVANSSRGELSVINMDTSKLVDLDPADPDTNVAPLGVLPEQIAASDDGCRIVTANRGSCDLTLVDVGTLMIPTLASEAAVAVPGASPATVSQPVVVWTATKGRLRVAPREVVFLPQDTSAVSGTQNFCGDRPFADPIGWNATPTAPAETQWKALVTFPTCNLVALVDLPTGKIVDSVKVTWRPDRTTVDVTPSGDDPDCPVHDFCDGRDGTAEPGNTADGGSADADSADAGSADAGSADGGAASAPSLGASPGALAIRPGGERAYVGLGQAPFVLALDIRKNQLVIPSVGEKIALHEGAVGSNRIRLSVDPYQATGIEGQLGGFVGEGPDRDRQYLYVIARDATVRVVDVSRSTRLLPEIECDANIDIGLVDEGQRAKYRATACIPADPPDFAHRHPLTTGPGIRLPAVPIDVTFADLTSTDPRRDWESVLDGAYAFVLTSSGAVYIVNIAPTLRTKTLANVTDGIAIDAVPPEEQPLPSSLRDHNFLTYVAAQDLTLGPPRVDLAPTVPTLGPQILGINALPVDNPTLAIIPAGTAYPLTYVFFPERTAVQRQTWNVTWEGPLFGPSFSGQLDKGSATLVDQGVDFCSAGVLPGDFVTIFGCTVDAQCGPLQVCRRGNTAPETAGALPINGLCVPLDAGEQAKQIDACALLLNSVRRYEIMTATAPAGKLTTLTLQPKLDEVVSQGLSACNAPPVPATSVDGGADAGADAGTEPEAGFGADAGAEAGTETGADAGADANPPGPSCGVASDPARQAFTCETVGSDPIKRCVQRCVDEHDCRSGRTCVLFGTQKFCADAPQLSDPMLADCHLDQLIAYSVGVGSGFLVQGTAPTPYVPGRVNPSSRSCEADPARLDRIPIYQTIGGVRTELSECDPALVLAPADPGLNAKLLARVQNGAPKIAAPCLIRTQVKQNDNDGGANDNDGGASTPAKLSGAPFYVLFQNRELRFVLANLENYLDDADQISFDVHGGFQADTVILPATVAIDTPARILMSPIDSQAQSVDLSRTHELPFLFVVDQRRLARASAGVSATRGQILRIYTRRVVSTDSNSLLPIYDDLVSSGSLWPIQ